MLRNLCSGTNQVVSICRWVPRMGQRHMSSPPWLLLGRFFAWMLAVLVLIAVDPPELLACPNCRDTLHQNGERLQWAFAASIGWMLMAPFFILTIWVTVIYRLCHQRPGDNAEKSGKSSAPASQNEAKSAATGYTR